MPTPSERPCDCGTAIRCADLNGPISYDPIYNEFNLIIGSRRQQLNYCFACGGKLPESTREKRYTTPSQPDCEDVAATIHRFRSASHIVHELGPSDITNEWDPRNNWPPAERPWRRQFVYTRRWTTVVLVIMEYNDGSLSFGINGQPITPAP